MSYRQFCVYFIKIKCPYMHVQNMLLTMLHQNKPNSNPRSRLVLLNVFLYNNNNNIIIIIVITVLWGYSFT